MYHDSTICENTICWIQDKKPFELEFEFQIFSTKSTDSCCNTNCEKSRIKNRNDIVLCVPFFYPTFRTTDWVQCLLNWIFKIHSWNARFSNSSTSFFLAFQKKLSNRLEYLLVDLWVHLSLLFSSVLPCCWNQTTCWWSCQHRYCLCYSCHSFPIYWNLNSYQELTRGF